MTLWLTGDLVVRFELAEKEHKAVDEKQFREAEQELLSEYLKLNFYEQANFADLADQSSQDKEEKEYSLSLIFKN